MQKIEPQLVRGWVYDALNKPSQAHISQLGQVLTSVYNRACQEGYLQPRIFGSSPSTTDIPDDVQNWVREVIWSLIIQGIIVPGRPNEFGSSGLPSFTITDWGKQCLAKGEYLPHDAVRYVEKIKTEIPNIDADVVLYLTESLCAFRSGAYLSSAVMTGVAAEKVLLLLQTAVENALPTAPRKQKFSAETGGRPAKKIHDEVWKRVQPVQAQLASSIGKDDICAELAGIFHLIRKTRNDAGHPTGRLVGREDAMGLLSLFPGYAKTAYGTIAWLGSNPLP